MTTEASSALRRAAVFLFLAVLTGACGEEEQASGDAEAPQDTVPAEAVQDTLAAADTAAPPAAQCTSCHEGLEESRLAIPALHFRESVHGAAGLDCVACHGGDATARGRQAAHQGIVHEPSRRRIPELCSRCHSSAWYMKRFDPDLRVDQLDRYRTSVHGQLLLGRGDTAVAVCTDCHSAHFITPSTDERSSVHPARLPGTCGGCHANPRHMASYDLPTDQLADYRRSVHWEMVTEQGDLSAPVCNDCHGNHGASPPDVEWVGAVCTNCHARIGEFFASSVHDSVFAFLGRPGCATCHGNHAIQRPGDAMLGLGERGVCGGSGCHTPGDSGGRVALAMAGAIDSLRASHARADSLLHVAETRGMPVSQAQYELSQSQNALINARAAVHTASLDSVTGAVSEGLEITRSGYDQGEAALEELETRELGLAVSAFVILILILGLVMKIRQLEAREQTAG